MKDKKYKSHLRAIWHGVKDARSKDFPLVELSENDRIDGKTCLITGANSGLGFGISVRLAERGGNIVMACRSDIPEAGEKVQAKSRSQKVRMKFVDLSDIESIVQFANQLEKENVILDRVVLNAVVVASKSRKTEQGLEEMFMVNYLAKFILLNLLLKKGIIPNNSFANNGKVDDPPRIVFVSSEAHRSARDLDIDSLGVYEEYYVKKTLDLYGYYKLALNTFAEELDRRLNSNGLEVSVHALCPGPTDSNIAREAPGYMKPLLSVLFKAFFKKPQIAADPVVYLTCSKEIDVQTGCYLHLMKSRSVDSRAKDPDLGRRLWEKSEFILESLGYTGSFS